MIPLHTKHNLQVICLLCWFPLSPTVFMGLGYVRKCGTKLNVNILGMTCELEYCLCNIGYMTICHSCSGAWILSENWDILSKVMNRFAWCGHVRTSKILLQLVIKLSGSDIPLITRSFHSDGLTHPLYDVHKTHSGLNHKNYQTLNLFKLTLTPINKKT